MQKSQTFQKPKKTDTPCNVPAVQKGKKSVFLSLLVLPLQKISDQKESEKNTWEKVTLLSLFETRMKEQW